MIKERVVPEMEQSSLFLGGREGGLDTIYKREGCSRYGAILSFYGGWREGGRVSRLKDMRYRILVL